MTAPEAKEKRPLTYGEKEAIRLAAKKTGIEEWVWEEFLKGGAEETKAKKEARQDG